jgi:hypothetical protein
MNLSHLKFILKYLLPACHYRLLAFLAKFLADIAAESSANKMNAANLATVFGPNMAGSLADCTEGVVYFTGMANAVAALIIDSCECIFNGVEGGKEYDSIAKSIYPFKGELETEISFESGDFIFVVERREKDGWWIGECKGKCGYFPSNYVELLDSNWEDADGLRTDAVAKKEQGDREAVENDTLNNPENNRDSRSIPDCSVKMKMKLMKEKLEEVQLGSKKLAATSENKGAHSSLSRIRLEDEGNLNGIKAAAIHGEHSKDVEVGKTAAEAHFIQPLKPAGSTDGLVYSIKKLAKMVEALQSKVQEQEKKIEILNQKMEKMEKIPE